MLTPDIIFRKGILWGSKHAPEILTFFSGVGLIGTTISAVKSTPKAVLLLEERKREVAEEKGKDPEDVKLGAVEVIKTCGQEYVPTAFWFVFTLACMTGATGIAVSRNVVLAGLYEMYKDRNTKLERAVQEEYGSKGYAQVQKRLVNNEFKENPCEVVKILTKENGPYLCYDVLSGRYFKNDIETIRRKANDVNRALRGQMYISLNEWYQELNLPRIDLGDDVGWTVEDPIELSFTTMLTEDNEPCLVVKYDIFPKHNYYKNW